MMIGMAWIVLMEHDVQHAAECLVAPLAVMQVIHEA